MSSDNTPADQSFSQAMGIVAIQTEPIKMSKIEQVSAIVNLVKELQSVDLNSSEARANYHSINAGNGDRIELVDDEITLKK